MNYDLILSEIFKGEEYDKAQALKILDWCIDNPHWERLAKKAPEGVWEAMEKTIEEVFKIPFSSITGDCRERGYTEPRFIVYALMRDEGLSTVEIGEKMHKHHSSVIWGSKMAHNWASFDYEFALKFNRAKNLFQKLLCKN